MSDKKWNIPSSIITEDMIEIARTEDNWHFAQNLNAMMRLGYCKKCGLVPAGCKNEGCREKEQVNNE